MKAVPAGTCRGALNGCGRGEDTGNEGERSHADTLCGCGPGVNVRISEGYGSVARPPRPGSVTS